VVFDIGNVIVRWHPRTLYTKIFPDPVVRDRFLAEVCTMAWHGETDRGLPFAENIRRLQARHPEHASAIAAWWERWPEMFSGKIPETEEAIEGLSRRNVPMFGLSNMSLEAWPDVRAMSPVFDKFEDVVISGAEGTIKPEPEIYAVMVRRAGRPAEELLFIDDVLANVEAAMEQGFHGHHFEDPKALHGVLRAHGLL
jgi:2-haloacid dehalogenase/putative hydrolase of the HAD superfamily